MDIHAFAKQGAVEEIAQLFKKGVMVDTQDIADRTSLHLAAEKGNFELCEFLLQKGASFEISDKAGLFFQFKEWWRGVKGDDEEYRSKPY
jgi:ankyrin repeat protein